nr:hypothetical protein [Tanacetum cinerariifolium]
RGELKVVKEVVLKVVVKSRHWWHGEDLFQEDDVFDGVDSSFSPKMDFKKVVEKVESCQLLEVMVVRHFGIEVVIVVRRFRARKEEKMVDDLDEWWFITWKEEENGEKHCIG